MADNTITELNGEILSQLKVKITAALANKKLGQADRTSLEVLQLFVIFLASDHEKLQEIHPFVVEQKKKAAEGVREKKADRQYYIRLAVGTVIGSLFGSASTAVVGWLAYAFQIKPVLEALAGK